MLYATGPFVKSISFGDLRAHSVADMAPELRKGTSHLKRNEVSK